MPPDETELIHAVRQLTQATNDLRQQLAVHGATHKAFEQKVDDHEIILRGDNKGSVGLVAKTNQLEKSMDSINKVAWAFFLPIVSLILIGVLFAAWLGLKGGIP